MKWLENNPLGVALASICGILILASAALAYVWSKPASSGDAVGDPVVQSDNETGKQINELGPITRYREVTERPVFDESRRPLVAMDGEGLDLDDEYGEVAGAPEVKLSGVVITRDVSLATLAPINGGESFIAIEGKFLDGEYAGWAVVDIKPRHIILATRDGEKKQVDLQVNTRRIEEPTKPTPEAEAPGSDVASSDGSQANGEQPLSRAEEIRQRIAERREELRRQAEMQEGEQANKPQATSSYQSAIQNMIKRKKEDEKKEQTSDDGTDG